MAKTRDAMRLTKQEVTEAFSSPHWAETFPPILSIDQAAQMLQIPQMTLYQWRSSGRLQGCCSKVGKHLRFFRDRLILRVMNDGI